MMNSMQQQNYPIGTGMTGSQSLAVLPTSHYQQKIPLAPNKAPKWVRATPSLNSSGYNIQQEHATLPKSIRDYKMANEHKIPQADLQQQVQTNLSDETQPLVDDGDTF